MYSTAADYKLIRAYLIDQGQRPNLLVKAFDGEPVSDCMWELETDYQQMLKMLG